MELVYEQKEYNEVMRKQFERLMEEENPKEFWRKYAILEKIMKHMIPESLKVGSFKDSILFFQEELKKLGSRKTNEHSTYQQIYEDFGIKFH